MNIGKTVFAQMMEFFPPYEFQKCVERCQGNYKIQFFSCRDQFLCMAFAQLTYRESLRDIQLCLRGNQQRLYHMGFRGTVSRNTLAHANQIRDWRIYADFAIIKKKLYLKPSLYAMLQILSVSLSEKTPLFQLLSQTKDDDKMTNASNQLKLL